ncbi:hypothetical protein D6D02_06523 [Aureobasidium pullulans]|nr:hypothetical protein D6D02_06523 [Aureobasidium pullulans]
MLLTLVPDPAMGATEALEGVVSLLSHEVFGTFVSGREGSTDGERSKPRFARASHHSACAHLIDLTTDKVGNAAKKGVSFADRATEPPIEKTDHALRAVVLTTADKCIIYAPAEQDHGARRRTNSYWPASQSDLLPPADDDNPIDTRFQDPSKAIEVGAENHEHLVAKIVNALQDKNLEHLYVPFAPEVQINVIAATFTILRALTSLKQSFSRHEHAFKVTNPGYANLGIMSLVSVFSKEGSPDNTIAVGSDNILSLTLPFGQVHDRCDEDNCGLVFPEQNISLDKLDLEALTHLGSRSTMLRELDLLGTFDLHQTPITTGRKVRPNKRAKAAGDNAEEDLIGTFIAWISQRGLVPT